MNLLQFMLFSELPIVFVCHLPFEITVLGYALKFFFLDLIWCEWNRHKSVDIHSHLIHATTFLVVIVVLYLLQRCNCEHFIQQERLKRMTSESVEARAEDLKRQYLLQMIHEIGTPLQVLLSANDTIAESGSCSQEIIELNNECRRALEMLIRLRERVVDITRQENGNRIVPNLKHVHVRNLVYKRCRKVMTGFNSGHYKKSVNISYKVESNVPRLIFSDEDLIWDMLCCLLSNAKKYTNEGNIDAIVKYDSKSKKVYFEVWDTGIGVHSSNREKLFTPFSQFQTDKGGTGLGLFSVKHKAEALGGEAGYKDRAQNDADHTKGSIFWFTVTNQERPQDFHRGSIGSRNSLGSRSSLVSCQWSIVSRTSTPLSYPRKASDDASNKALHLSQPHRSSIADLLLRRTSSANSFKQDECIQTLDVSFRNKECPRTLSPCCESASSFQFPSSFSAKESNMTEGADKNSEPSDDLMMETKHLPAFSRSISSFRCSDETALWPQTSESDLVRERKSSIFVNTFPSKLQPGPRYFTAVSEDSMEEIKMATMQAPRDSEEAKENKEELSLPQTKHMGGIRVQQRKCSVASSTASSRKSSFAGQRKSVEITDTFYQLVEGQMEDGNSTLSNIRKGLLVPDNKTHPNEDTKLRSKVPFNDVQKRLWRGSFQQQPSLGDTILPPISVRGRRISYQVDERTVKPVYSAQSSSDIILIDGTPASVAQSKTILLIEDEKLVAKMISRMLISNGYLVELAENGEAGLMKLMQRQYQCVFSDITMPVMDGYETLRRFREWEIYMRSNQGRQYICALSANSDDKSKKRALESGFDNFLSKPTPKKVLLCEIEKTKSLQPK